MRNDALHTLATMSLSALVGCSPAVDMPALPDGGMADAGASPDAYENPCGGAAPTTLRGVEGGRIEVMRTGQLVLEGLRVEGDLEATLEPNRIWLRLPYGAGPHTARFVCATGAVSTTVEVERLRWERVAEWTADEAMGIPGGREYFAWWMSPTAADRALYLYGGFAYRPRQFTPRQDLYRFDLETATWSQVTQTGPLPQPGGRVAAGLGTDIRYFGGASSGADGGIDTAPTFMSWSGSATGASFTELPTTGAVGSYTGSLIYDARRERWLSICGADTVSLGLHCAVHEYTEARGWRRITPTGTRPMGRYGFHYAYDRETDRVILFAGQTGSANTAIRGDTWALELSPEGGEPGTMAWVQLFDEVEGISRRRNGAYVLDPMGHRLFIWGGTPDGADSVPGLDILTLDRGHEAWTHIELGGPPSRTSGQGIYDPAEQRLLFGFGNDDAVYTDLWSIAVSAPATR